MNIIWNQDHNSLPASEEFVKGNAQGTIPINVPLTFCDKDVINIANDTDFDTLKDIFVYYAFTENKRMSVVIWQYK